MAEALNEIEELKRKLAEAENRAKKAEEAVAVVMEIEKSELKVTHHI